MERMAHLKIISEGGLNYADVYGDGISRAEGVKILKSQGMGNFDIHICKKVLRDYPYSYEYVELSGHEYPIVADCPSCTCEKNRDEAFIHPEYGVCMKCGFNIKSLPKEEIAKIFGLE